MSEFKKNKIEKREAERKAEKRRNYNKRRNQRQNNGDMRGRQGRKDSDDKRVNYDNERISKFLAAMDDKSNDVAWYTKFKQLMEAAANISYYGNAGEFLPFRQGAQTIPGIMTIDYCQDLFGDGGEAINQTANSNYSFTVHGNSRNTKYNAPDQMLLKLAGKDVFAYLAIGLRVYGTMRNYEQLNYYTPKALVQAQGFNFSDLNQQLSDMLFDLNDMIAQTHQIWLPNDMPIVARQFWMNTNMYEDGESIKSQIYFYRPEYFLVYDEEASSTGGMLRPMTMDDILTGAEKTQYHITDLHVPFGPNAFLQWDCDNGGMTWDIYKRGFKFLISSLLDSEDRGLIYGDILKAYGAESLYTITEIDANYKTVPVSKHAEVLSQFENLTINPYYPTGIGQDPNTNTLFSWYQEFESDQDYSLFTQPQNFMGPTALINFHGAAFPSTEQIIVATRCTSLLAQRASNMRRWDGSQFSFPAGSANPTTIPMYPTASGTEVANRATVYSFNKVASTASLSQKRVLEDTIYTGGQIPGDLLIKWAAFDWSPAVYLPNASDDPESSVAAMSTDKNDIVMEVDNFTTVDAHVMRKIHKAALYSLLGMLEN
nr:capsid protein [Rat picobirnavirus]